MNANTNTTILSNLRLLNIENNEISDNSFIHLVDAFKCLKFIDSLNFAYNNVGN